MAVLDTLVFRTKVDLSGWTKGLAEGNRLIAGLRKLEPLAFPTMGRPDAAAMPAPAPPPVPPVALNLDKSLAPLGKLLGKQAALFEKMAGSILATNRRMDADLKYEAFQRNIGKLRQRVVAGFDEMGEAAQKRAKKIDTALGAVQGFSKLKNAITGLISHDRQAQAEIDRIKPKLLSLGTVGTTAVKGVAGATEKATSTFKGLGLAIGISLGPLALIAGGLGFLKQGVVAAAGLNETVSKSNAVFGAAAGSVEGYADGVAAKFGLVKKDTLDVAAGFGGLYKGLGDQSGAALATSTQKMTQLAADLSSYANLSFAEAGQALRTALSGETSDTLKGLGVITTDNAVSAYAYSHGIGKLGDELTEAQKLAARTGLIFEGLADAQGDLERTGGSSANQFRALTGRLTNLASAVGTSLMPAVDAGLSILTTLVGTLGAAFASSQGTFEGYVARLASGLRFVAAAVSQPGAAFAVLKLKGQEVFTNIGGWATATFENLVANLGYAGRVAVSFFSDLAANGLASLRNLGNNFAKLGDSLRAFLLNPMKGFTVSFDPITKGFRTTIEALPDMVAPTLVDLSKEIAEAGKPINEAFARREKAAAEAKAATPMSEAAAGVPKKAAISEKLADFVKDLREGLKSPLDKYRELIGHANEALKEKLISPEEFRKADAYARKEAGLEGPKFAGAQDIGSREAYSTLVQAMSGRGNDFGLRIQEQTLKANNQQVSELKQLNKKFGAANDPGPVPMMKV